MPEADLEIHLRHPVVTDGHRHQAKRHQPTRIKLPTQQKYRLRTIAPIEVIPDGDIASPETRAS